MGEEMDDEAKAVCAPMDPVLAARLQQQLDKCDTGESSVESCRFPFDPRAPMDPVLGARLQQQQDKCDTGESSVEHVGSVAEKKARIEARRLAEQERRCVTLAEKRARSSAATGRSVVKDVHSTVNKSEKLDPVLAQRLARQKEKLERGMSDADQIDSVPQPVANPSAKLDPVLSRRLTRQLDKLETGESAVDHAASVASCSSTVV